MIRLILRTCYQCGFDQSEYDHKTIDIDIPKAEALMVRNGGGYSIIGAEVLPQDNAEESQPHRTTNQGQK